MGQSLLGLVGGIAKEKVPNRAGLHHKHKEQEWKAVGVTDEGAEILLTRLVIIASRAQNLTFRRAIVELPVPRRVYNSTNCTSLPVEAFLASVGR